MARSRGGVLAIFDAVERHHPDADTELVFRNAFELLVATVLSAQSTDRRVNEVSPALFARYPSPAAMAQAEPTEVEALVHSTGFFRQKVPDGRRILAWDDRRDVATVWDTVARDVRDVSGLPGPSELDLSNDGRTLILNRQVAEADIWMLTLE